MNYILKLLVVFLLSLVLIFCLAACKDNGEKGDNPSSDVSSSNSSDTYLDSSSLSGSEDGGIDVNDIFGESQSSQSSSEESSSESGASSSEDETSSDSSSSGGKEFNYDDPSVWTDPV